LRRQKAPPPALIFCPVTMELSDIWREDNKVPAFQKSIEIVRKAKAEE